MTHKRELKDNLLRSNRSCYLGPIRIFVVLFFIMASPYVLADTPIQLLKNNKISKIEALLTNVQQHFEKGSLSETELRNAFRIFYKLDAVEARNLAQWASSSPKSYVAHLAYGIYLKRRGSDARGEDWISETPQKNIDLMDRYYDHANKELRASLLLTKKPYLSIFHLLTISTQNGEKESSLALLRQANRVYPDNAFVRNRYAISLRPRWGGSYEELDKFISDTKKEGVPSSVIYQLEALEQEDIGQTLEEHKNHVAAMKHFKRALDLAALVGDTFAQDWLPVSRYYVCTKENSSPVCQ